MPPSGGSYIRAPLTRVGAPSSSKPRLFPSIREYRLLFGVDGERMKKARPNVLLLAPGPINRGVEVTPEVADGPNSAILDQVTNGLAVRMAVLSELSRAA